MPRTKVKCALIESKSKRKASYKKRQKGFLKKSHELSTLCGVEMATVMYSPYHNEPEVFPDLDAAVNTFRKFRELSVLDQSKHMLTVEEFTKQRIEKMKKQLHKIRKENTVKEFTIMMNEVLNGKDIPADMHPYDLNDLMYVMNQNLKRIRESMKAKADGEGSTLNAPQPIVGSMVHGGTSSEGPRAPLLATVGAPVSVTPSMVPGGTNYEGPSAPLLVPVVAPMPMVSPVDPLMVPSVSSAQMPKPMFHLVGPLRTPQMVPLVDPSSVSPSLPLSPVFSSEMFPPMVLQMYPPIPQQMALRRAPRMAPPMPPTTMASIIPSPMMAPPMTPQTNPSMNIAPMDASLPMNYYQNYSIGFPQSPSLCEMLDWNDDDLMTLIDDPSFNNINFQDPNHSNNF